MNNHILGIHHVTAIAGDPQKNFDFYTGVLGLRMVKKTVNFDDPYTYHLYYGDEVGHPGTLMTFFPWSSQGHQGRKGTGQLIVYSFSIPHDGIGFWMEWLQARHIKFTGPLKRFTEEVLTIVDPDGFELELVASLSDPRPGWENGVIPHSYAIHGFHGVTLSEIGYERTAGFLTSSLGFRRVGESGNRFRFEVGGGGPGSIVDILCEQDRPNGFMGVGAVHHVAWRTPDDQTQLLVREKLVEDGYSVTPVIDRNYFHSIYFNEPGGIIFEVATDPPGFIIDESKETLGTQLKLPEQYEPYRADIERSLPSIRLPETHFENTTKG